VLRHHAGVRLGRRRGAEAAVHGGLAGGAAGVRAALADPHVQGAQHRLVRPRLTSRSALWATSTTLALHLAMADATCNPPRLYLYALRELQRQGRSDETQPTLQDQHRHPRHNQHQLRVPPPPRRAMVQGGVGRAPLRVHRRADVQREELGWRVPSQMVLDAGESPTRLPHPFPLHPSCAAPPSSASLIAPSCTSALTTTTCTLRCAAASRH
jgi:hypothetical protein